MKNVFAQADAAELTSRINQLHPDTKGLWGKMTVDQMLAHCNVTYEFVYEQNHPKPNPVKRLLLTLFVKKFVVNEKPYKRNGRTAPEFIIRGDKDFEAERSRLIRYIQKTQELGAAHFQNKESHSFGRLSSQEWNNMFYKHLDHHLSQFGV
ncbi:DUF1569 domain-containing protein [Pontibacter sp. E15-1]|uniref:DUF1569 domain-containing protein n=1 Tax=Pontibacter sp. E15-1 TaxID=2919918 RepID=UPI001F4F3EF5|nr:DUF1569 domain-containing protein [Pontibacter sp. E15-1]MCJ8164100.1 DUF1569 domain-containing protein [Pontibacter sp. E15-1]